MNLVENNRNETVNEEQTGEVTGEQEELFVEDVLAGQSQEEMALIYEDTLKDFIPGEVVRGRVVGVSEDKVVVDINYKSEGVIARGEFPRDIEINVDDEFDVFLEETEGEEGMPILSKMKADRIKNWTNVQRAYNEDSALDGRILRRVKGGLKVDVNGLEAFLPASQLSARPPGDLDKFIGQVLGFKVIKLNRRRRNIVLSRRKLLEEERAKEKEKLLGTLEVGQLIEGEVKNITDFGAFVDVGGIDGLLHVSDMSWKRVRHPSDVVSVGQQLEVKVLNFDPETERISLGLKQKVPNPWLGVEDKYPVGDVITGTVVSMTDYGAFVELEEGVEGMIHVSEMSWTHRIRHPSDVLEVGQEVEVKVLNTDPEHEKIALGLKQTTPNPWEELAEKYPAGSVVEGEVKNLTDYGVFIEVEEDIDGLLHVSDMSWTRRVSHPSEMVSKGDRVKVKVLGVDADREKVSLGLKQLERDPWLDVADKFSVGDHIEVTISKLVSFGAFAALDNGIEGLIHVSELAKDRVAKPEDVASVDDKVDVKIIGLDPAERKIALSVKGYLRDIEEEAKRKYGVQPGGETVSVGEIVGEAVPPSFLEEGKSIEEKAVEMMAEGVDSAEAPKEEPEPPAAPDDQPTEEPKAEEPKEEPEPPAAPDEQPTEEPKEEPEPPAARDEQPTEEPKEEPEPAPAPDEQPTEEPKEEPEPAPAPGEQPTEEPPPETEETPQA
jgi:small subunit ribosomal protein S1